MKTWLQDPNRKGLLLFLSILIVLIILALIYKHVEAKEVTDSETEKMILLLVNEAPRHPANGYTYRSNLAECIDIASEKNKVPPALVTAVSFRESSFRSDVVGPAGEIGVMQVHPSTAKRFGCDMSTVYGQISCGTRVLKYGEKKCGSWKGAISVYGSKTATCKPKKNSRLERMVKDRISLKKKLETKILGRLDAATNRKHI